MSPKPKRQPSKAAQERVSRQMQALDARIKDSGSQQIRQPREASRRSQLGSN